jgi:hypothetical protein
MAIARGGHTAELLSEDRILVAGGRVNLHDPAALDGMGMEVIDLRPGRDITVYRKAPRRIGHTLARLITGRILLLGGTEADGPMKAQSTWLHDPAADTWVFPSGPTGTPPVYHSATPLPDGTVLVAGGRRNGFPVSPVEGRVFVFDPAADTTRELPPLHKARADHTATLLLDGRVLIAGGWGQGGTLGDAEIYDPAAGRRTAIEGAAPRDGHTATLLLDGRVLFVGGSDAASAQLFDPRSSSFLPAEAPPEPGRRHHTATLLASGAVLVAGGHVPDRGLTSNAAVYDAASGTWRAVAPLRTARQDHTATRLGDGRVVIAGGYSVADGADERPRMDPYVRSTEIFSDP